MTLAARTDAFNEPFVVKVVDGEILLMSDQAPVNLVLSADAAADTAHRLLLAVEMLRDIQTTPHP
jgi:hypothetical protein